MRSRLTAGLERFVTDWRSRLAAAHWRQVQALCVRLGDDVAEGYAELQPIAELTALANEALRGFAARRIYEAGGRAEVTGVRLSRALSPASCRRRP